ncbi:MAG TPA: RsmB/NOP family class I SAM-dependent RNA methyltransferase [Pseudomonadales bacterium]|nr:RsmB/NOP family class I SAM-dependent RNA methyltransferase [Pseudomonadales bacterium]
MTDALPPHLARYAALLDDYDAFVDNVAVPLPQTVATNTSRLTGAAMAALCADHLSLTPVDWFPGAYRLHHEDRPGRHWSWSAGLYTVQEEASLVPVRMLDARPGQRVLDLCAAPGNKTVQIALMLDNRGTLIANDIKMVRLSAVHDSCRRLGLLNVTTTGHDGSVYPVDDGQFDRILVDAPCTSEGKARRGYMRASPPKFRTWVTGQQRALLRRAAALVRPGGRIVYSTCTFAPEENEAVVSDALEAADGRLRAVAPTFEVPGAAPGLEAFEGRRFHPDLRHARRLWPHRTDTGGFFAVTLERVDDGSEVTAPTLQALPDAAPIETVERYLERFALPEAVTADLHFFLDSRHLRAVRSDHAPPAGIQLENIGIDFARRRSTHPKITTGTAMAIGQRAGRNVVELDGEELERWRAREELALPKARLAGCERGYQLVRSNGLVHGTGFLRLDDAGDGRLESQFPKAWMRGRPADAGATDPAVEADDPDTA